MSFLNYFIDRPFATNNPSVDQPNMQINTNSTSDWVLIDHHGFEDNIGGYHTIIHQDSITPSARTIDRTQSFTGAGAPVNFPAGIPGINQIFSADVTTASGTDTQLFSLTGNGDAITNLGLSQLTGNFSSTQGYQWIGNILVMWGFVNTVVAGHGSFASGTADGTVLFNSITGLSSYPNSLFAVFTTLWFNSGPGVPNGSGSVSIDQAAANINRGKFTWEFNSNSSKYTGFYWVAIGN